MNHGIFCQIQLNSYLLLRCPITPALETSPTPFRDSCATHAPPVALSTPAIWSTALTSALSAPASRPPLSTVAVRRPAVSPSGTRRPTWYPDPARCPATYNQRSSMLYNPCRTTYPRPLGFRSSSYSSLRSRFRSCYSLACKSSGFVETLASLPHTLEPWIQILPSSLFWFSASLWI